jgi:hypothetical protein
MDTFLQDAVLPLLPQLPELGLQALHCQVHRHRLALQPRLPHPQSVYIVLQLVRKLVDLRHSLVLLEIVEKLLYLEHDGLDYQPHAVLHPQQQSILHLLQLLTPSDQDVQHLLLHVHRLGNQLALVAAPLQKTLKLILHSLHLSHRHKGKVYPQSLELAL